MGKPLIIQYVNLLHKHKDVNAKKVQRFLRKHRDDEVLMRRVATLNRLFAQTNTLRAIINTLKGTT